MHAIALLIAVTGVFGGTPSFYGVVTDADEKPLSGAAVFIEPGLNGSLIRTDTNVDGAYRFKDVPTGPVGIFAVASGYAVGGSHVNVQHDDGAKMIDLKLSPSSSISGEIIDAQGNPVESAKLDRIVILGEIKVGIPLSKLGAYGLPVPTSNAKGKFDCGMLPEKGKVAIKVLHDNYAQEIVNDAEVGDQSLRITMSDGVKATGEVKSRSSQKLVSNADIMFRNTTPPHETCFTRSNSEGVFTVRLKPGEYLYQAATETLQSPAWTPITITGKSREEKIDLQVLGRGIIRGDVRDVLTRKPIPGAQILVKCEGSIAAVAQTGDEGAYQTYTAEGANIVSLDVVDGYQMPSGNSVKISVEEGKLVELPTFWLKALPSWRIKAIDSEGNILPGAVATVIQPRQFGWRANDAQGEIPITIASMPADGKVRGIVEDSERPLIGSFILASDSPREAIVHLFPCAKVSGKVVMKKEKSQSGVVVGGLFDQTNTPDFAPVWRTVTDKNGEFTWPSVLSGEAQHCVAYGEDGQSAKSMTFTAAQGTEHALGNLVIKRAPDARTAMGESIKWTEYSLVCGPPIESEATKGKKALIFFAKPDEADMVIDTATSAHHILAKRDVSVAVVITGAFAGQDTAIPVLTGKAPGVGTTYVLDSRGRVIFETFDLPPMRVFQENTVK